MVFEELYGSSGGDGGGGHFGSGWVEVVVVVVVVVWRVLGFGLVLDEGSHGNGRRRRLWEERGKKE